MAQSPKNASSDSSSQEIHPLFYGTRMFITVFTTARLLSPSWARRIQSTTSILLP